MRVVVSSCGSVSCPPRKNKGAAENPNLSAQCTIVACHRRIVSPIAAMIRPMEGDLGMSFDSDSVRTTYDAWGDVVNPETAVVSENKSLYSQTVRDWGYDCPELATDVLVRALSSRGAISQIDRTHGLRMLDVGCADGLQAESLCTAGVLRQNDFSSNSMEGMDLSPKLLRRAMESGGYKNLICDDLNRCDFGETDVATARFANNAFHVTFCVGVLTYVDPLAYAERDEDKPDARKRKNPLRELASVTSRLVIFTCRTDTCEAWEAIADEMVLDSTWTQLEKKKVPYLPKNKTYTDKGVEAKIYAYVVTSGVDEYSASS